MRRGFFAAILVALAGVSGCGPLASGLGGDPGNAVAEFQHYQDAVRAQHRAGMAVLDRLAIAERRLLTFERGSDGASFDPGDAAAILGIGDPPRTASLRAAVKALQAYNDLLVGVGSGLDDPTLRAAMGAAFGGASVTPDQVLGRFSQIQSLAQRITSFASGRGALLTDVVAAGDDAIELVRALRAATPAIWQVFSAAAVEPGNLTDPDGVPPLARTRLAADRRLLAGWVLLLDQSVIAIELAVGVTRSADPGNITALLAATSRLRGLAEAIAMTGIE